MGFFMFKTFLKINAQKFFYPTGIAYIYYIIITTTNMNVKEITSAIAAGKFNEQDLRQINTVIVASLKAHRNVKNAVAKSQLEVGMEVVVNHPKLAGRTFDLVSIKRTKASIRPRGEMFGGYTVPLSLVESV